MDREKGILVKTIYFYFPGCKKKLVFKLVYLLGFDFFLESSINVSKTTMK